MTDLPLSPQDLIAQNVVDRSFMLYWTMPDPADASVLAYELELTPECTIEIDGDACTTSAKDDPGDPTTITIVTSDGMAWPTCRPVEYPCDAKCGDDENPWPAVNIGADPTSGACADDACKGCRKNADDRGAGVAAPARTGGECPVLSLDLRACYKEVSGVRPNTQYEVKVVARNSVGGSIAAGRRDGASKAARLAGDVAETLLHEKLANSLLRRGVDVLAGELPARTTYVVVVRPTRLQSASSRVHDLVRA